MTNGGGFTVATIAVVVFAFCDLVHEILGHGLAVLLVPGVQAISLSSVALQTTGQSWLVAAAGSLANIFIGCAAMAGLTAIPSLVENKVGRRETGAGAVSFNATWVAAGVVVAILFIAVVGRGIAW